MLSPSKHDRFTAEAAENVEEIKIPPLTKALGVKRIPAPVADELAAHAENQPVIAHGDVEVDKLLFGLRRRQQMLAAVQQVFRLTQPFMGIGVQRLLPDSLLEGFL